jgi:hypothetical protein
MSKVNITTQSYRRYISIIQKYGVEYSYQYLDRNISKSGDKYIISEEFKNKVLIRVCGVKGLNPGMERAIRTGVKPNQMHYILQLHAELLELYGQDYTYYLIDRVLVVPFLPRAIF